MISIPRASCGRRFLWYQKIGKGKLLHCWKARITRDHTERAGDQVYCPCGQHIGVEEGPWINLHNGSFSVKGSALKK
ncbi:MAG TPA: hypothetical protein PLM96_08295 [Methanoregulaceae archaeon]|nr:hypothetical protein [Methanoregulaceae archaeon]MDD5685074.1 hypothetical protein [Methanoregulaceae archaeon]HOP67653.1 hypothetical protein [Methanoregulaceae archaeon]HPJ74729.1 hypothetical protein [Methanoregulaceae archaeon]HPQ76627.1 hypothetical protein [Methanoregulaceae archaeon]